MDINKKQTLETLFSKIYSKEGREEIEHIMLKIKTELESISGIDSVVTTRIKSPISLIKKYLSDDKYTLDWNKMKDLVGLMVIVENNQDVDNILYYIENAYASYKNPNSRALYKDYRVINIREDHGEASKPAVGYDQPIKKGYQTNDGYKNVRVNLMVNEFPIEIQVKTREQYIAHEATHDPVYKTSSIKDERIRQEISDKLFPYFEASAHLQLHSSDMLPFIRNQCVEDIRAIYNRNSAFYRQYRDIYEDACHTYAFYLFITNNMKHIFADSTFGNVSLNFKLLEIEAKRVFHSIEKEYSQSRTSYTPNQIFNLTINKFASMSYEEFCQKKDELKGNFRCAKCVISGVFDLLRKRDVDLFKRLSESFRDVEVNVYDDELAKIYLGKAPMFSFDDRIETLRNIKGISGINKIDIDGNTISCDNYDFLDVNPFFDRKYTIGYLPGVFDMLHPGHVSYIKQVCDQCEQVYIGSKSDQYVRVIKHKEPVLSFEERHSILKSIRGIEDVVLTEFDITPPENILKIMDEKTKMGQRCAIFMGSDWINHPERKGESSKLELENLKKNYPLICLTSIPREENSRSSTNYRKNGLESLTNENPYEITLLEG